MFPDEPDTKIVEMEQVLKSNVKASYQHQTSIRCYIDQTAVDEVQWQLKQATLKLKNVNSQFVDI